MMYIKLKETEVQVEKGCIIIINDQKMSLDNCVEVRGMQNPRISSDISWQKEDIGDSSDVTADVWEVEDIIESKWAHGLSRETGERS